MTITNHTTQSNPYLPDRDSKASSEDFMKRKRMEHLLEVFKTMDLNLPRALMVKRYNISDHDSFGFIKLAAVVRELLNVDPNTIDRENVLLVNLIKLAQAYPRDTDVNDPVIREAFRYIVRNRELTSTSEVAEMFGLSKSSSCTLFKLAEQMAYERLYTEDVSLAKGAIREMFLEAIRLRPIRTLDDNLSG